MKLKTILSTCGLCLLPILFGIAVYDKLPAQMPIHWNFEGNIDDYASKETVIFLLPVLMAGVQLFCLFMMQKDPKYKNYSAKMKKIVIWIIPALTVIIMGIVYAIVLGYDVSINFVIPLFIGVLFIILGNYLPKCRQNFTLGFRVPWTLNDEENWNKTNRLAGYIMVIGGILIVVMSFFDLGLYGLVAAVLTLTIIPTVYSYLIYRAKHL